MAAAAAAHTSKPFDICPLMHQTRLLPLAALLPLLLATVPAQAASDAEQLARKAWIDGNHAAVKDACQAAAEAGDAGCMELLGRNLLAAKNPDRDGKAGQQWLQKAIDAGSTSAMNALAFEHYSGNTLEPNADLALSLWNKAAQAGNTTAIGNLGPLYRDGRLLPRDLAKARELFEKAPDDMSRANLAAMLFYGEGGDRQTDRAFSLWAELVQSKSPNAAKRAQADLDKARKVAAAERADVAIYLNPWHPDVRRNLDGQWVLKDLAGARQLTACWPDAVLQAVAADVTAVLPGYDARAVAQLQKQLNDSKQSGAVLNLSRAANCSKTAPLLVLTRQASPGLPANGPVTLDGQSRETRQLASVSLAALVLDATLEARDKSAEAFNEGFADKVGRWQLAEASASGKPLYAVLSTATPGSTASQAVCTLKGEAVPAAAIATLGDYWARRKLNLANGSGNGNGNGNGNAGNTAKAAPAEFDSAEALFDALTAKASTCPVVVAPVAVANKLSQAMVRDKLSHKVFADAGWTTTGLAESAARAKGYADAAQAAFAAMLNASPDDIQRLVGAGLKQADDLKATLKRATTTAYPGPLATVDQVIAFLDDEATARKLKKTATIVAKDRLAADEAARKRKEAEEAAARQKTELAAAEQKRRDEADSNAEQLSERAGVAGPLACRSAADDHVSKVARYAYKWDDAGFAAVLFDRFMTKAPRPGVVTLVSNHLSLQNGFGAYKRVKALCEYDTRSKRVASVDIINGD